MTGNLPAVLMNVHRLFLKLYRFICNQLPVVSDHSYYYYHSNDRGEPTGS